jgi:hypothetical protein
MSLKITSSTDLWKLVDEIRKPFDNRDAKWKKRRDIRFRRMDEELASLPLNPLVSDTALMVTQDESPNQEVHKRVKRLVANKPRFEAVVYDDTPKTQREGQELEDGIKALYKWMNRGKITFDWLLTQFQQGDGLGIGKEVFVPGHGDVLGAYDRDTIDEDNEDEGEDGKEGSQARNKARGKYREALAATGNDDKAYDKVTEDALRAELPPFRFVAVDPLACYWWEDDDGIEVMVEVGEKTLHPLLATFGDYGLRYDSEQNRLYTEDGADVAGGQTTVEYERSDLSTRVNYTEVRTRDKIGILVEHPIIRLKAGQNPRNLSSDERGVMMVFDNPFGPYTTGYVLVPADITTENDEADRFQPPILAALNVAQPLNILATAQLSAALENALAPKYVKVSPEQQVSTSDEDKSPEAKEGEIPSIAGEIKRVEKTAVELERIQDRLLGQAAPYTFQDALSGDATSDTSGHRLAIQVAQADIQMVPYQNARADAIKELMMGIIYAVRRHGLTIYIPTLPDSIRSSGGSRVTDQAKLTPEMADLHFDLIVSLGSETPVTTYAKWQALQQREEAGTLGFQSLMEQSNVENPEDEINRVFEGKMLKATMEQAIPQLAEMIATAVKTRMQSFLEPPEEEIPPDMMQADPASGTVAGGGFQAGSDVGPMLPGIGMNPAGPSTGDYGPPVPEGGGDMQVPPL